MTSDLHFDADSPLRPKNAVAAIIVVEGSDYLLQHRDPKPTIFFPNHWSCFGGEAEGSETPAETVQRELQEELGIAVDFAELKYFTTFEFDMGFAAGPRISRTFYELQISRQRLAGLRVLEGQGMTVTNARRALMELRLAPYDGFALWMHYARSRFEFDTSVGTS